MKSITFFNNKGGVGKTTLLCNMAAYFAIEQQKKVLVIDADPQCNATQYMFEDKQLDYLYNETSTFTIYSVVRPIEQGRGYSKKIKIHKSNTFGVDVLPGDPRLALMEDLLARDWGAAISGDTRGIRTSVLFVELLERYQDYDIVLFDVGPSLGSINRAVLIGCSYFLSPMSTDIFSLKAIENIVIGAGVSRNYPSKDGNNNPPLWDEFLRSALEKVGKNGTRHIKSAINNNDLLHACEWLRNRLDDNWDNFLRETFIYPGYQHCQLHDKIFRLDQRVVFSMNVDNIYETFVTGQTDGQTLIKKYHDDDVYKFLRDDSNYIIKVHGSVDAPDKIIFTQADYASARTKYSAFYQVLDAAILSNTILFIGCGINDPDLNLVLENQNFKFPLSQPHYLLTSSNISLDLEKSIRRNRNLKCIKYDPSNNHAELLTLIEDLILTVEAQRSDTAPN